MKEWPDFFIVGAAKSGTTSLYHYLNEHPSIFMPDIKEPWFFSFYRKDKRYICPNLKSNIITHEKEYNSLFTNANSSQIKGEASVIYLFRYEETIQNMTNLMEDFFNKKIIIILRNPVERAFSHYRMFLSTLVAEKEFFSKAIQNKTRTHLINCCPFYDYISPGMYYDQVKAYINNFNNVFVCLYEDLKFNPKEVMIRVYDFLEVDSQFIPNYSKFYNVGMGNKMYMGIKGNLRRVKHSIETRLRQGTLYPYPYTNEDEMYQEFYQLYPQIYSMFYQDIIALQNLIDRDLSAWINI